MPDLRSLTDVSEPLLFSCLSCSGKSKALSQRILPLETKQLERSIAQLLLACFLFSWPVNGITARLRNGKGDWEGGLGGRDGRREEGREIECCARLRALIEMLYPNCSCRLKFCTSSRSINACRGRHAPIMMLSDAYRLRSPTQTHASPNNRL